MDIIISIGSWLVIISARFIYFICLYGVAIEDVFSLGVEQQNESERYKQVKLVRVVLSIVGLAWLWSNTVIGLICFIICSIAYSYRETRSGQPGGGEETTTRDWKIFQRVKYLIRCMIGIWWSWSHLNLVFYLSVIAFIVKWAIVLWLRDARFNQDNTNNIIEENTDEDTNAKKSKHDLVYGPLSLICLVLIHSFLFYKAIVFASKKFWCNRWSARVPSTLGSPISADHDNEEGSSLCNRDSTNHVVGGLTTPRTSIYVGGNENDGGTQIIGGTSIAEKILNIGENGVRDINFNNFVMQEVRRSSCSVLSFFAYFLVPGFAIYFVLSGVKTTILSNLEQE
ncbi:uncharacterized protein LOC141614814 [Silene latifolia]|uniref:uncharacterized protein LOC141614814 n=1 Tax=Silene latifolia TaxID=37657 RepID=UPI003D784D83